MEPPIQTYSPEWDEARKTRLGASDMGALLGVSPWDSPADVWASKRGAGRPQSDGSVNTPIWWGHQEEPSIITAAVYEIVGEIDLPHVLTGWSWVIDGLMVSPDAVLTDEQTDPVDIPETLHALVEAKVVGLRSGYLWRLGPPQHVLAQAHTQMAVTGAVRCHVAARIAGAPVKVWPVDRDDELCAGLLNVVEQFWSYDDEPPHWEMLVEPVVRGL